MELSSITIKWFNSLDNTFYKFTTMTKLEKIKEITNQILELKKLGRSLDTKRTIQKLQQELGELTKNDTFN